MNTADELEKILLQNKEQFETPDLRRFQDLMQQMQVLGLVIKQDYSIPPIDTLGKKLYESFRASVCAE